MAHAAQQAWCLSVKQRYPQHFVGKRVLDVGSLDINGNNRSLFPDCTVIGIDVVPGRNVDIVDPDGMGHYFSIYRPLMMFDTIISTEQLEHDREWKDTLYTIVSILKPGGLFLFTCATTGRSEHGTQRSRPDDCPGLPWRDYYRNLTVADIRSAIDVDTVFAEHEFRVEGQDLYGYGIKR